MREHSADFGQGHGLAAGFAVLLGALLRRNIAQNKDGALTGRGLRLLRQMPLASLNPAWQPAIGNVEFPHCFAGFFLICKSFQIFETAHSIDSAQLRSVPRGKVLARPQKALGLWIENGNLALAAKNQHSARHEVHNLLQSQSHALVLSLAFLERRIAPREFQAQLAYFAL